MSDFCKQCSIDIWGEDTEDMKGISNEQDTLNNMYALVLCEDCGPCQVDHNGKCVSPDCSKTHGKD